MKGRVGQGSHNVPTIYGEVGLFHWWDCWGRTKALTVGATEGYPMGSTTGPPLVGFPWDTTTRGNQGAGSRGNRGLVVWLLNTPL